MLLFHKKYQANEFSQNGEDGILKEVLHRLGISTGLVVEFGAHDGQFCSNSRALILQGWEAFLIEGDPGLSAQCSKLYEKRDDVEVFCEMIGPNNVNHIIPPKCDVLSIDVDGIDYWIWDAYTGDAKVVIIEINSSLKPLEHMAGDKDLGSSYAAMWRLGITKGYFLLCHCGNMIFVKLEYISLFPELTNAFGRTFHPIQDIQLFFNTSWQH